MIAPPGRWPSGKWVTTRRGLHGPSSPRKDCVAVAAAVLRTPGSMRARLYEITGPELLSYSLTCLPPFSGESATADRVVRAVSHEEKQATFYAAGNSSRRLTWGVLH